MEKKLYRSRQYKVVAGICGGLADYFNVDPVIVRVIFIVACFGWGASLLAYLILWIIVPVNPLYDIPVEKMENRPPEDEGHLRGAGERRKSNGKLIFGIILIGVGVIAFLNNFVPEIEFRFVFPLILIAIGVALIMKISNKNKVEKTEAL